MKCLKVYLLSFFLFTIYLKANSSDNINDIKSLLEGRYELVFWVQDNLKFNYPKVAGTLVLKDNKLVLTSVTGKQSWELDKKSLVYRDKEWGEEKDEVIRYWKRIE